MSDDDRLRWNQRYREQLARTPGAPSPSVEALSRWLPRQGRALDLAGGGGRHAFWMARRGLEVTLVDVSDVAIESVVAQATLWRAPVDAVRLDLEVETVPEGPWALVLIHGYLNRRLVREVANLLEPGGVLVVAHPTRRNLERNPRPGAHHLLLPGELPRLTAGLEITYYDEGWNEVGLHEARLVARRNPSVTSAQAPLTSTSPASRRT